MNTRQQTIGSCVEDEHEIDTETIEVVSSVPGQGFEVEADCSMCEARRHKFVEISEMGVLSE